jgi:hypothetical protein
VPSATIDLRAKSQKNSPPYPMRIRITLSHHGVGRLLYRSQSAAGPDRNWEISRRRLRLGRWNSARKKHRRRETLDWLNIECELHVLNHWRKIPNSKTGARTAEFEVRAHVLKSRSVTSRGHPFAGGVAPACEAP